jgi:hypothetical protein
MRKLDARRQQRGVNQVSGDSCGHLLNERLIAAFGNTPPRMVLSCHVLHVKIVLKQQLGGEVKVFRVQLAEFSLGLGECDDCGSSQHHETRTWATSSVICLKSGPSPPLLYLT